MRNSFLLLLLGLFGFQPAGAQQKGYYRTPALYQNTVIFTAEGDLWKYDLTSHQASRLTTHSGTESSPIISPDGKQLAFLGQYEGVTELYLMNSNGGIPKRITYDFDGYDIWPSGWTRDGKILYRSTKYSRLPIPQLLKLDPRTLHSEAVPLAQASEGCYDESGTLFFTRLPNQGSKTKRYKGGFIEQIWKFDGSHEARCLTGDFDGTSAWPMLYHDRVFFLSDRDGTMNLWSMNKEGKELKQLSFSKGWDLQTPYIYESRIVYQKGADIYLYDIASGEEKLLDISLQSDFDQRKPRWIKSPVASITNNDISPNGKYLAIISRGRLFVSPAKSDRWMELTHRSGIRYKEAHFINDKSLAVLSDQSGEYEIWKMNADGSDSAVQLTHHTIPLIKSFTVSPDGKLLAYTDKNEVLRVVDAGSGQVKFSYDSSFGGTWDLSWSPDSRYLNFSRGIENQNAQICILDLQSQKILPLTSTRVNSYNPVWTADSNWIYFISERNLHSKVGSPWGARQPEPYYTETQNIYALPLDTQAHFPFLQSDSWLSDTVFSPAVKRPGLKQSPDSDAPSAKSGGKKKGLHPPPPKLRNYDWDLAASTLYQVPLKSGNLGGLANADGWLYWLDYGLNNTDGAGKLMALKMEESKKIEPVEIASGVTGFSVSANQKKILIDFQNRSMAITDANGQKADPEKSKVELENWNFRINPVEDWKEMFADAWRMMRDYFYDREMHRVDWNAIRSQYEPLVDRITERGELDDLIGQMVAELSALHTFIASPDKRRGPDFINIGFLGAVLQKEPGGFRIGHIYENDPDYPDFTSPLHRPELKIKSGDLITAVNNYPLSGVEDISEQLANKVGIPVKLSLLNRNGQPYDQVVRPYSGGEEYILKYGEWELSRRQQVDSLSHNDIGYVHLKAMGGGDMDDFVKQFYPVFDRKGLIIDVRHNFGGNIDSWVLEKLIRKAWMFWQGRSGGPTWNMPYAFRGHMVILCDQITSSDGEAITEGFRRLGLGKVIGMRTWGGEIWLSFDNRLVDNGIASAAEIGVYGPESKWLIEGRGVEPDITVDNLPFETFQGRDAQLEAAIDYLKKKILAEPISVPPVPKHPDKSFKY